MSSQKGCVATQPFCPSHAAGGLEWHPPNRHFLKLPTEDGDSGSAASRIHRAADDHPHENGTPKWPFSLAIRRMAYDVPERPEVVG